MVGGVYVVIGGHSAQSLMPLLEKSLLLLGLPDDVESVSTSRRPLDMVTVVAETRDGRKK